MMKDPASLPENYSFYVCAVCWQRVPCEKQCKVEVRVPLQSRVVRGIKG